jgi:hypothetical protein
MSETHSKVLVHTVACRAVSRHRSQTGSPATRVVRLLERKSSTVVGVEKLEARKEAGSNTSTVALRVVGGDEKGTQCLGVAPGHPVPGGYKHGGMAFQFWGVSNPRQ